MKTMKNIVAALMAVAMLLAMAVPAFAASGTSDTDINITHAIQGATYNGYRLLDTTTSLKSENCHSNVEDHLSTCYNIAYSVNDKYLEILKTETNATTETGIIDYIKGLTTAESIREFADDIYAAIGVKALEYERTTNGGENNTATLTGVEQGYWLIVETINDENYDGAYSLVMLDTAGSRDITVATKRDEPGLTKYVRDNGMSYGQGADMQIGDKAEFLLIADVPNPIGYANYTYLIHDKMSAGLTFNVDSVEIRLNGVDGTVLENTYYTVTTNEICTDCDFHISVDVKTATEKSVMKGDDRLYISYTATLNEDANILVTGQDTANANPNTAWLQYSNNPYNDSKDSGKTTVTAESTVYVWTFPLTLKKVDKDGVGLTGAKFVLSKDGKLDETYLGGTDSSKLVPMIKVNDTTYRVVSADYAAENADKIVYVIEAGTAVLQGFDDQVEYYLYEVKAPAGYNKLSAPISFKFFAEYSEVTGETMKMKAGFPKVAINDGTEESVLEANVVNQTGVELPSTGGIGTTIFYAVGGLLVLGAVVLLITKKRMGAEK